VRTEWQLFAGAAAFFAVVATVYGLTSDERAGSVMLTLAVGALALIAVYLRLQGRRIGGPRPEDLPDADPGAGAGDVGYFPNSSIWPFVLALGAVVTANAFVFGIWLAIFGGLLFLTAVVGYATEAQA
jgi:hypothetical protein